MEIARESIFVSTLRTFCRMFFGMIAILFALFLFSLLFSSFSSGSLMEVKTTMEILPDASGKRELVPISAPAILQIAVHGVIGDPKTLDEEIFQNILIDSRTGLLAANRVKGILLHFNTPGGTVDDSDAIYRLLKGYKQRYKIPIFAYVDGLCASGGMYVASSADQIFASPTSIIGSVGVLFGPFFNAYDLMGKIGLQARTLTEGKDKDMMNPTRPWQEGEDDSLKAIMAFNYERFVTIVTEARGRLDRDKLVNEYGAQVFDCIKAEQLGYIDHAMTSRDEALLALLQAAHIDPDKPYQVVSLAPKGNWVEDVISGKSPLTSGKMEHSFDLGKIHARGQFSYLYQP